MTGWLKGWGEPTSSPSGMQVPGMMSETAMKKFGTLSGKDFDKTFLQMMIKHHQGAVTPWPRPNRSEAPTHTPGRWPSIVASQSTEITKCRTCSRTCEGPLPR